MSDGVRSYTDEELQAILRRALQRQAAKADGFGHDELMAAAREVGLDEDDVERAIAELAHERSLDDVRTSMVKRRREKWLRHLVTYLVVVGGLLGMHALTLAGSWVFWVAFGWGIGIALDTYKTLRGPTEEEVSRERDRLNRKERRKRAAEARREAKRRRLEELRTRRERKRARSEASEQLERVIEEGVTLLLGVAARKLREATEQMERSGKVPDTDFGRYVARKQAEANGKAWSQPAPRGEPRVRVDTSEEPAEVEEQPEELEAKRRRSRRLG